MRAADEIVARFALIPPRWFPIHGEECAKVAALIIDEETHAARLAEAAQIALDTLHAVANRCGSITHGTDADTKRARELLRAALAAYEGR